GLRPRHVFCDPRTRVTWPVRAISRMPYLVSRVTKASTFSPLPVTSSVIVLSVRSTTLARKTLAISMISSRVAGVTLTLIRASTPGAFCTSTEMVAACCRSVIQDHLRHRLPGRNHRQAVLLRVAEDVDHARHALRGQRGAQSPLNLFGPLDADAACAVGVAQLGEVRVAQDG